MHTLLGLDISVQEELALKYYEYTQTGLPVALLSCIGMHYLVINHHFILVK